MTLPEFPTGAEGIIIGTVCLAAGLITIAYIARPGEERIWPVLLVLGAVTASCIWIT